MFLLRRTAVRAVSASPSATLLSKPRSITSITPAAFRARQQQWSLASFQRRFASDEATKTDATQAAAADVPENFAQTAAEAPVEANLTEPVDASSTAGATLSYTAEPTAPTGSNAPTPDDRTARPPVQPHTMLYVGNLFYEVNADQLRRVFSKFGEIENTRIVYDNQGLSRGFGYVEFKTVEDAQAAIDSLNMQVFEGRNIVVQFHQPKENRTTRFRGGSGANEPSKTLFIGNMSFEMSDKDLNDLFRDVRNVTDVRVAIDRRTGQPRGFAHADFIDVASATQAKEALKEKIVYGRQLRIDFGKSTPPSRSSGRFNPAGEH